MSPPRSCVIVGCHRGFARWQTTVMGGAGMGEDADPNCSNRRRSRSECACPNVVSSTQRPAANRRIDATRPVVAP